MTKLNIENVKSTLKSLLNSKILTKQLVNQLIQTDVPQTEVKGKLHWNK